MLAVGLAVSCATGEPEDGMNPMDAERAFRSYLATNNLQLDTLDAESAIGAMLGFFEARPANDVDDNGGDQLLFQWGVYAWQDPAKPSFEYNITRQLIVESGEDDDEGFWQLSLTLRYPPTEQAHALGKGDHWCTTAAEIDDCRSFIEQHPTTAFARATAATERVLEFGPAG